MPRGRSCRRNGQGLSSRLSLWACPLSRRVAALQLCYRQAGGSSNDEEGGGGAGAGRERRRRPNPPPPPIGWDRRARLRSGVGRASGSCVVVPGLVRRVPVSRVLVALPVRPVVVAGIVAVGFDV